MFTFRPFQPSRLPVHFYRSSASSSLRRSFRIAAIRSELSISSTSLPVSGFCALLSGQTPNTGSKSGGFNPTISPLYLPDTLRNYSGASKVDVGIE